MYMKRSICWVVATWVMGGLIGCGSTPFSEQITGRWASNTCESAGPAGFLQRSFDLAPTSWTIQVRIFGDNACQARLMTLDAKGALELVGPSAQVAGAYEMNYVFSSRTLTPAAQPIVDQLNTAKCAGKTNWAVGQSGDITVSGCPALGIEPKPPCDKEMDLNRLEGTQLYFGDRSASLCTTRPSKLGAVPVVRQ